MAVITSTGFLEALEKSELLSPSQLASIRKAARDTDDSKDLARQLMKQGHLTRWQAAMLLQGRHGVRLGKYVLLEQIGSGELGHVFLAKHAQMARRVALKVLSRRHSSNAQSIERFVTEARKIAALDHRNIIHLYEFDNADNRYFLVMEYVAGRDLEHLVSEDGPLPPVKVAEYMRQAAAGLIHAHQKGVVHGDLKPANLLIDEQGTVKILDIGVARLNEAGAEPDEETGPGISHYVAPEQASGGGVDDRTDLYSLGCIGYFLLTGKPPFADGPDSPPAMVKICRKMMAAKPDDRFQSAAAVEKALQKWLEQNQPANTVAESESAATVKPAPAKAAPANNGNKPPVKSAAPAPARTSAAPPKRTAAAESGEEPEFNLDIGGKGKPPTVEADDVPFLINTGDSKQPAAVASEFKIDLGGNEQSTSSADSEVGIDVGKKDQPKAEPAPAFAIDAAPKRKSKPAAAPAVKAEAAPKRKQKAAPAPAAVEAEDELDDEAADETSADESDAPRKPQPSRSKLWLIIGGASAAGVLALVGIVLLVVFLFSGKKPKEVAEVPPAAENQAAPADAPNPEPANSETAEAEKPPVVGRPVIQTPDEPENPAAAPADNKPADTEPPAATDDKPPADQATNPVPQPEPPDNKTPPADPEPEKTEPPKSEPPKAEPPKPAPPQNPFRDLAKSVELPPLGGSEEPQPASAGPVALSPVYVNPGELFFIDLEGGDKAEKTKTFSMSSVPGSDRDWNIVAAPATGAEVKLAQLAVKDDQLLFQWTAEAAAETAANHLRNCVLSLRTGTAQERLALRKPIDIGAVTVDMDKGMKASFRIPWLPAPDTIRVDVAVDGKIPATRFDPSPTMEVGGETNIWFGDGTAQVLYFKFDCAAKREIEVTATPYFKSPYDTKPVRFTKTKLNETVNKLNIDQQLTTQRINFIGDPNKIQDRRQQGLAIQAKSQAEQNLAAMQAASAEFQKVATFYDDVNGTGQVKVRLYAVIGVTQVELANTGAAPAN